MVNYSVWSIVRLIFIIIDEIMNLFECSLFEEAFRFRSEVFVTDESDLERESIRMD